MVWAPSRRPGARPPRGCQRGVSDVRHPLSPNPARGHSPSRMAAAEEEPIRVAPAAIIASAASAVWRALRRLSSQAAAGAGSRGSRHAPGRYRRRGHRPPGPVEMVLLARQRLPCPGDRHGSAGRPLHRRGASGGTGQDAQGGAATCARTLAGSPSYGEHCRAGEAIFTAFTESAVNQVIAKPMVKKQQMRWTPHGARLLPQVRARGAHRPARRRLPPLAPRLQPGADPRGARGAGSPLSRSPMPRGWCLSR